MTNVATTEQEHAVRGVVSKPWRLAEGWQRGKSVLLAKIMLALVLGATAIWFLLSFGCEHERVTLGGVFIVGDRCR